MSDTASPREGDVRAVWEPMVLAPTSPAAAHLDDDALLRTLSQPEYKHVTECGWCRERQRIAQASDPAADGDDEEFEQALDDIAWEGVFAASAAEAVLPSKVRRLMTLHAIPDAVVPGQLWRLTWKERHLLVVIIAIDGWHVLVAPATTDSAMADEFTLVVAAEHSPIDVELAVRVRQRTAVPLFVLDRCLGALLSIGDERLAAVDALDALVRTQQCGSSVTGLATVGEPLFADDTDAISLADAVIEEVAWFADAAGGLHHLPGQESQNQSGGSPATARRLADVIVDSGLDLPQLVERTGLSASRLLDLRRGAPAEKHEVRAIASGTGSTGNPSMPAIDGEVFDAAMAAVSAPLRRTARVSWTQRNVPDADPEDPSELARWLVCEPFAARSVPGRPTTDDADVVHGYWRDRVAMVLAEFS